MVLDESGVVDHVIDLLVQLETLDVATKLLDELQETVHRGFGLRTEQAARDAMRRRVHKSARGLRLLAHHVEGLRADAAHRQIHDPLERRVVGVIRDQAQVGERVLDFRALEEPQAAVHLVRDARGQEDSSSTRDCALLR